MFPQNILTFRSWENIYLKFIFLFEIWITKFQKELDKPQSPIPNMYFKKRNNRFKGRSL